MSRSPASRDDPGFPWLGEAGSFEFPEPSLADPFGVLCSGGNLSPGMVLSAYRQGVFPWFNDDDPILWWSPDPRFVLVPWELHVSRTMRRVFRSGRFELSADRAFRAVIESCAARERPGQNGTWITGDMIEAYVRLHELGWAHSVETWLDGELVGGCYGISIGDAFFGESMFSRADDASKAAFIALTLVLREDGIALIDSQVRTEHVASLGGREVPRNEYLERLRSALKAPTRKGSWADRWPDFPHSAAMDRILSGGLP
ncbi:MAG: leucyl/phenylalanyl-tRNA--protein transferase [Spirochaetales bacterium]|nr:leucyl/phenylalanyl-tRNA--protein transferase [Spirochaetales bacterium]